MLLSDMLSVFINTVELTLLQIMRRVSPLEVAKKQNNGTLFFF